MLLVSILFLLPLVNANAIDLTFQWDANTEENLAGYKIYKSDTNGETWQIVDVGNVLTYTWINCEEDRLLLFVLTAYNTDDLESSKSYGLWYNGIWLKPF